MLKKLNLSSFHYSDKVKLDCMFFRCCIDYVNLCNFNFAISNNFSSMFERATIKVLDISKMLVLNKLSTYELDTVFSDCEIEKLILNRKCDIEDRMPNEAFIKEFVYV